MCSYWSSKGSQGLHVQGQAVKEECLTLKVGHYDPRNTDNHLPHYTM